MDGFEAGGSRSFMEFGDNRSAGYILLCLDLCFICKLCFVEFTLIN